MTETTTTDRTGKGVVVEAITNESGPPLKPWVVIVRLKYRRGSEAEHGQVKKLYRVASTPDEAASRALKLPSAQVILAVEPVPADQVREVFFSRGQTPEGGGA